MQDCIIFIFILHLFLNAVHTYIIRIIILDDLDKARQKCKLSEETSDLQTDDQNIDIRKRKRIVPRKFLSTDEEEESDEIHVRPPKLNKKFLPTIQKTTEKTTILTEGELFSVLIC